MIERIKNAIESKNAVEFKSIIMNELVPSNPYTNTEWYSLLFQDFSPLGENLGKIMKILLAKYSSKMTISGNEYRLVANEVLEHTLDLALGLTPRANSEEKMCVGLQIITPADQQNPIGHYSYSKNFQRTENGIVVESKKESSSEDLLPQQQYFITCVDFEEPFVLHSEL